MAQSGPLLQVRRRSLDQGRAPGQEPSKPQGIDGLEIANQGWFSSIGKRGPTFLLLLLALVVLLFQTHENTSLKFLGMGKGGNVPRSLQAVADCGSESLGEGTNGCTEELMRHWGEHVGNTICIDGCDFISTDVASAVCANLNVCHFSAPTPAPTSSTELQVDGSDGYDECEGLERGGRTRCYRTGCIQIIRHLPGAIAQDFCRRKKVFRLGNSDFSQGTYIIDAPGIYVLTEDIVFAPTTPKMFPLPGDATYNLTEEYTLGFFAAIVVKSDDVFIDLGSHTIESSLEFSLRMRFFSIIELANSPFPPGAGPPQFKVLTKPIVSATDVVIANGNLGRTSHMSIHGNNNDRIWVHNVNMYDFETGGIMLNNASNVFVDEVIIGPSLGAPGRDPVPAMATLNQAILLLQRVEGSDHAGLPAFVALEAAVEQFIAQRKAGVSPDPAAPFADPAHGFANMSDGSAMYGISITPVGPAVGNFGECSTDLTNSTHVTLRDVTIRGLYLKTDEVVQLRRDPATLDFRPFMGPAGDTFQVLRVKDQNGQYQGNVLADAQLALAKQAAASVVNSMSSGQYFQLFGGINIPSELVNWADGITGFDDMVSAVGGHFKCDVDSMTHHNKGIVGIRLECVEDLKSHRVNISDLVQMGQRSNFQGCMESDPYTTYTGTDVRAIQLTPLKGRPMLSGRGRARNNIITKVSSAYGFAIGLEQRHGQGGFQSRHMRDDDIADIARSESWDIDMRDVHGSDAKASIWMSSVAAGPIVDHGCR